MIVKNYFYFYILSAINLIRNPSVRTLASEAIQEAILSHLAE
jgi:hypothetical protein